MTLTKIADLTAKAKTPQTDILYRQGVIVLPSLTEPLYVSFGEAVLNAIGAFVIDTEPEDGGERSSYVVLSPMFDQQEPGASLPQYTVQITREIDDDGTFDFTLARVDPDNDSQDMPDE